MTPYALGGSITLRMLTSGATNEGRESLNMPAFEGGRCEGKEESMDSDWPLYVIAGVKEVILFSH